MRIVYLLIILILPLGLISQNLEEDNLVLYTKANILFESGRYDEAIRMYNRVLKNDANHTAALFMRAKTKFELSAFKGTKMDILLFIEKAGVNKELIKLMAKTEMRLSNNMAALNYVQTGLELDPYDDDLLLVSGEVYLKTGDRNEACEQLQRAAQLGNSRAQNRLKESCFSLGSNQSNKIDEEVEEDENDPVEIEEESQSETQSEGGIVSLEDIVREAEDNEPTIVTNPTSTPNIDKSTRNQVEIDDKLSILFTNGIGHREVVSQPSIFMLSDQDGTVVLDLCIDADGKVSEVVFNRDESTIFRSSLTSLALRKARSFVFSASRAQEQCGVMVFNIRR